MNLELMLQEYQSKAVQWWASMGPDGPYYLWLAGGLLMFFAWAWFAHRLMRKLSGHRKFRGTWYNADQFEVLIKMINEDNAKGNRIMKHDEMSLLRHWRYGRDGVGMDRSAGYF